ncbi:MAG: hypothetical protein HY549_12655 [Elusimicrobia bacterium]|nr:hypothetical protein [Elusimicrobiota bacterium]
MRDVLLWMGVLVAAVPASAQILATSARQLSKGSLKILGYYQGVKGQVHTFSINGAGSCTTASGSVSFPCDQAGDVEAKGSGGGAVVKILGQPFEGGQYYGLLGVGGYSLRVPSTTITNTLSGDSPGLTAGFGAKATIIPDTIVTPAVAFDFSVTYSQYKFNRRFPGGSGLDHRINQRLRFWQYQVALESSHLFVDAFSGWDIEPYGGVKYFFTESYLKDYQDGSRAGGKRHMASPFLGFKVPMWDQEGLFAEASFVDGYQFGAGLEIRFN